MNEVLRRIGEIGIIPVVKIENARDALPLGKALLEGELPIAEITFRTAAAEETISTLTEKLPEMLVGAGTVLTVRQVKEAVGAGAKFIVSPGFNPKVVDHCISNDITVIPGVNNPSTVEMGLERGLEVLKFFPAESSGGLKFLKDMAAPYGKVKFIPTGGINISNLNTYLATPIVHACAGTWITPSTLIVQGKFIEITRLALEAVYTMLGFEFSHLGINEENKTKAKKSADAFVKLFSFPIIENSYAFFAGKGLEIMKVSSPGKHGHIAIATNHIQRAIASLERKGVLIERGSKYEEDNKLRAVYLEKEISGFAIHLLQK